MKRPWLRLWRAGQRRRGATAAPARTLTLLVLVLVSLVVAPLSGCGFRLRGAAEIPPELSPIYIQASGGSGVRAAILQRLALSQVRPAVSAADAQVILRILQESRRSRVAAVDRGGKVVATELFLTVTFDAVGADGRMLAKPQTLDLSRTYENPDVEVLGKQLEADLIREDLTQDAADRVIDRLRLALL
jgi:LPS-assembly lipoprotein